MLYGVYLCLSVTLGIPIKRQSSSSNKKSSKQCERGAKCARGRQHECQYIVYLVGDQSHVRD